MERLGYVYRERRSDSRKKVYIYLTDKGPGKRRMPSTRDLVHLGSEEAVLKARPRRASAKRA